MHAKFGQLALAAVLLYLSVVAFGTYRSIRRHGEIDASVRADVHSLVSKRPDDIPKAEWEFLVGWTINCYANCLSVHTFVDAAEYEVFSRELARRVREEPLRIEFFDWFWDRVERISKIGPRYSENYRPTVPERLQTAKEGFFGLNVR